MSFMKSAFGSVAALALSVLPQIAAAEKACAVPVLYEILPYMVSSGTDNDVNEALTGMASSYYSAIGDGASGAGDAAGTSKAGLLLKAAGTGAKGLSALLDKLPEVISSVDSARDDADDLYMSFSSERGHEAAFFPSFGEYTDRFSPGVPVGLEGVEGRVVPYIFGVDPNRNNITVTLFDHDTTSRDDIIGSLRFHQNDAGKGRLTGFSLSEKHGGVVYAFEYEIVKITCQPSWDIALKPMYLGTGFSTLEAAMVTTTVSIGFLKQAAPELRSMGIYEF